MEIKKFRSNYGLELITASHANVSLGDLVWDPLTGKPSFSHPGMPSSIYSALLDAELLKVEEFQSLQQESKETKLIAAHLADKQIDVQSEFIPELKHPSIGKLEGNFKLEAISKFQFGEIMVRPMSDLLRIKIDQHLEDMKAKKWEEYDGRIRRVHMITELYYGTIKLIVERSLSSQFDASIEASGVEVLSKSSSSRSVEYEFGHDEVPFAMRIEKVRSFNG